MERRGNLHKVMLVSNIQDTTTIGVPRPLVASKFFASNQSWVLGHRFPDPLYSTFLSHHLQSIKIININHLIKVTTSIQATASGQTPM